jgi:tetratricopeptide (TPR) repeat protein
MKWMIWVVALSAGMASAEQFQLGGKPAPLQTPYKSEHEWAIGETTADILDVAAVIRGSRPAAPEPRPAKPWNPHLFVPFARAALGTVTAKDGSSLPAQYVALADPTALTIVRANEAVSAALRQHPASPRAHEAAALVLATFGLREAANDLSDVRWTLNRMTAHLALAEALRGSAAGGVDGQLASVAFYALANRTATALGVLDGIADRPGDAPLSAWKRALRLRLTHDWRVAAAPMRGHRIEKLEHFRARRKTLRALRAGQELSALNEPGAADFTRIIQTFTYGVEDGNQYVSDALGGELLELAEVYRAMHRRELPAGLPAEIVNARPVRLMHHGQPTVLPWGAWAEFFQRHIGMYVGEIDDFQRRMLGSPGVADRTKSALDAGLRHLTLFPIASSRRTKGRGLEADLTYINQAVDLASRAPELVNYDYWLFLDMGARHEMVRAGMPPYVPWFVAPTADIPYDAGIRIQLGGIATPDLEALVAEASSDVSLASRALGPRPQNQKLIARVVAWLKVRAEYDIWAVNAAVSWARTLPEQIEWQRHGCAIAITECVDLASLLARAGDETGAVTEYERAFRDPGIDVVTVANSAGWLVSYYERTGQMQRAYDLAERAAATGSSGGITTLARLYERRNRVEEAAPLYERLAKRYERSNDELAGFLYRQAIVAKKPAYLTRWRSVEKALFPNGLQPVPAAMSDQPAGGVFIYNDSNTTRRVRLQVGDIIVGVDGWLVENKEQYSAVMAFGDPNAMHKVTAWRGVLFTVDLPENNGADLQTHPLKGWIQ